VQSLVAAQAYVIAETQLGILVAGLCLNRSPTVSQVMYVVARVVIMTEVRGRRGVERWSVVWGMVAYGGAEGYSV
jgi:hypothetical protein